jgi:hypothetical protein
VLLQYYIICVDPLALLSIEGLHRAVLILPCCYNVIKMLLQCCYPDVTVFLKCFYRVLTVLQCCCTSSVCVDLLALLSVEGLDGAVVDVIHL